LRMERRPLVLAEAAVHGEGRPEALDVLGEPREVAALVLGGQGGQLAREQGGADAPERDAQQGSHLARSQERKGDRDSRAGGHGASAVLVLTAGPPSGQWTVRDAPRGAFWFPRRPRLRQELRGRPCFLLNEKGARRSRHGRGRQVLRHAGAPRGNVLSLSLAG